MKKVFFILFIFCSSLLHAKSGKVLDSLKNVLKTEKSDSNKVNTLNAICRKLYKSGSYDTSFVYANNALALAKTINYPKGIATAYSNSGIIYWYLSNYHKALECDSIALTLFNQIDDKINSAYCLTNIGDVYGELSNYPKALDYLMRALELSEQAGNKSVIATSLKSIGSIYTDQGNYPKALEYDLKALSLYQSIGFKSGAAADLNNLGIIYDDMGNYSKSLEYHFKTLSLDSELNDKSGIAADYSEIGITYHETKKYPSALEYYLKALAINNVLQDRQGIANNLGNIGNVYTDMGRFAEGLDYVFRALAINRSLENKTAITINFCNLGNIYTKQKNYKPARIYLDSGINLSKKIGEKEIVKSIYLALSTLDSAEGNYAAGLEDFKKFIVYRDSLVNESNTKKTTQAEMNFEFEQKQATEKAEQDKKDAVALQDRKKQEVIRNSFIGGFAIMLALAFFIFRGYRQKQKANEIITLQKEEVEKQKILVERQKALVEEKNKDILDSITYAKRLQDAILPPMSIIKQFLPESFVLYKPKDIVAGDFYWLERAGDTILIAAADCTGHGVPGALVSVVCSNALNRTVKEFKITEPGKILDKVRELVLETFEKSESNVQDGMDISLAAITASLPSKGGFEESSSDKNTNLVHGSPLGSGGAVTVQWSGANNSLWYIQNEELKEIVPDKQPIGKTYNPKPFTTHTFTIPKVSPLGSGGAATLYLFTDGYADQFGGEKGKKFKYKQLEEKLLAISQQPLAEQKNILTKEFNDWKGNLEQVDDVLIIGIRV